MRTYWNRHEAPSILVSVIPEMIHNTWLQCGFILVSAISLGCGQETHSQGEPKASGPLSPSTPDPVDVVPEISPDVDIELNQQVPTPESEENLRTSDPPPSLEALQELVIESLELGETEKAWSMIRQAARMDREDFDTRYLMARVLAERNRFTEAVKILDELSGEDPQIQLPVWGQTAEWLTYDGKWSLAEERYRKLIDALPEVGLAHRKLAELRLRQGYRREACAIFQLLCEGGNVEEFELRQLLRIGRPFAGELATDEWTPVGLLGKACHLFGENQPEATLGLLEKAGPSEVRAIALRGRLLATLNQSEKLAQWNHDWVADPVDDSGYWYAQGVHAQNTGDHSKAVEFFCECLLTDATDPEAYHRFSESLKQIGQSEASQQATRRAKQLEETHEIGSLFTKDESRDPRKVAELCTLLDDLKRPLESLSWQAVAMVYNQQSLSMTNENLTLQLKAINQKRMQIIEAGSQSATDQFILCGIEHDPIIHRLP
ncbi:MAG: tetratricopeptide repeat protein [Planctomycetota bacterium]|nr:tetratricopeptide repeat protein [Planctomycetota bacterium]